MSETRKVKRLRKVYCLRIRQDDQSEWSQPDVFTSKKQRDQAASQCRIIGGLRTHSFERYEK